VERTHGVGVVRSGFEFDDCAVEFALDEAKSKQLCNAGFTFQPEIFQGLRRRVRDVSTLPGERVLLHVPELRECYGLP